MRKELLMGFALAIGSTAAYSLTFTEWDVNGDGIITTDEYTTYVSDAALFTDWDTTGDGFIDEDEWTAIGWDYDYGTWDVNSDGYLDSGELYDGYYSSYDNDGDSEWSDSEWENANEDGYFQ